MKQVSIEYLRECFSPDFTLGVLVWNRRPEHHFPSLVASKIWNTKFSGKVAGSLKKGGYRRVGINDADYLVHRVIFSMFYGAWPEQEIDHIDGDPSNNAISNLRSVAHKDNLANQKLNAKNTSGASGVYFIRRLNRWAAQMKRNQHTWHLGTFNTFDEAAAARKAAEIEFGFHANHGRVA